MGPDDAGNVEPNMKHTARKRRKYLEFGLVHPQPLARKVPQTVDRRDMWGDGMMTSVEAGLLRASTAPGGPASVATVSRAGKDGPALSAPDAEPAPAPEPLPAPLAETPAPASLLPSTEPAPPRPNSQVSRFPSPTTAASS